MKRSVSCPKMFNEKVEAVSKKYNNFINDNLRKGPKPPTWSQNLRYYFRDYCQCSGVHGVRYLGERGRYMIEKLTWSVFITLMWYFCISLSLKAYSKWTTSPVIVTFATQETAISQIPFPAVTICPEVKSDPEVFNFTDVVMKKMFAGHITSNEERYFEALLLICDSIGGAILANTDAEPPFTVSESTMNAMREVLPEMDSYNTYLYWLDERYALDYTLSQTFTSEGVCYSFNMLHFDEILVDSEDYVRQRSLENTKPKLWTLEDGYSAGSAHQTFPYRTYVSGISGSLRLEIYTNHSDLDYICKTCLQGFKVVLHHPTELPNMDRHFRLPLDQAVLVAIKPRLITVSKELKPYKSEARACYFAKERRLTFFRSYTQQNCLDECLSNFTLMSCDCVPFYLPKLFSSPICGYGSNECIRNSKAWLLWEQATMNSSKNKNYVRCNCLPACTSLEYDVEISQADLNWRKSYRILQFLLEGELGTEGDLKQYHMSMLQVFYQEMQFLSLERNEVYGLLGFIANMGGFLGLFIGFSVTSVIEIVYFLTLRLACNFKKFGSGFWSGQQNISDQ